MLKFTSVAMEEVLDDLIKFEMSEKESDTPVEPDESESSSPGPGLL
jgi:DNA-directed RNA polymerase subunit K/omega